jgi:hypothetical protein
MARIEPHPDSFWGIAVSVEAEAVIRRLWVAK